jgi:hypothetical protein
MISDACLCVAGHRILYSTGSASGSAKGRQGSALFRQGLGRMSEYIIILYIYMIYNIVYIYIQVHLFNSDFTKLHVSCQIPFSAMS